MGSLAFEGAGPGESGTFSDLYNPCSGLGLTGSGLWTTTIWRSSLAGGFPLTTGFEIKYYFTNVPAPPAMFLSLMIPLGGRAKARMNTKLLAWTLRAFLKKMLIL
jgi:hypothetical protein